MLFFIILFWNLCSAVQVHPIHLTHMKEIWWCIITCVQNHNLLCVGKSKFTVHCVYTNLMCVEKSEFTVQLCVHKLTSVKLDQTHTELITGWSLLWIWVPTRWSKTGWVEFGLEWKVHFRSNFCAMLNSQTHCDKRLRKEISEERKQILTPAQDSHKSTLINL